jgi:hypothetical protein
MSRRPLFVAAILAALGIAMLSAISTVLSRSVAGTILDLDLSQTTHPARPAGVPTAWMAYRSLAG